MAALISKLPPVAADLPFSTISAARKSTATMASCLAEIGRYLNVKRLYPVSSGRAALYAILKALLPSGSKVILPGYTCYTVLSAVIRAGMIPVLSDSDPADLGYDLDGLKKTLARHSDTRAIIVCHLFGIPLDIERIREITGSDMLLIDDAAQAFGISVDDRFLGTGGDVGFYSFGRGKNLALGGGGLLVTAHDRHAEKIENILSREFPFRRPSTADMLKTSAYNLAVRPFIFSLVSRLPGMRLGRSVCDPNFNISSGSEFRMRLLALMYSHIEKLNRDRRQVADQYRDLLEGNDGISIPASRLRNTPGTLRFPVLVTDTNRRESIVKKGIRNGWGISPMYPAALNALTQIPELTGYSLPSAECIARSIITLPTHRHLQAADRASGLIKKIAGLFS